MARSVGEIDARAARKGERNGEEDVSPAVRQKEEKKSGLLYISRRERHAGTKKTEQIRLCRGGKEESLVLGNPRAQSGKENGTDNARRTTKIQRGSLEEKQRNEVAFHAAIERETRLNESQTTAGQQRGSSIGESTIRPWNKTLGAAGAERWRTPDNLLEIMTWPREAEG
ncbi:hypothetical protein HN011_010662 [Eciton burchellii]|nr:hypothetical protein HN011_010662 [Eciton burchellii]